MGKGFRRMVTNLDVLDFLDLIPLADLIVTSPPYNLGKAYDDQRTDYFEWQREVITKCVDKLADNGSLCYQVGHQIVGSGKSKSVYPLDLVLYPIFIKLGLKLKNRIVWQFGHGLHDTYRFSGRHETILWFVKGDDYTFNLDPVRVPSKYPNKKYYKGPKKGQLSGNPLGKNPSDCWSIPNVKNNHVEKTNHPCQFPVGLVERLILALTNEGDVVVDPFIGAGSTAIAAVKHNRQIWGNDNDPEYVKLTNQRIEATLAGTIKTRPMNQTVYGERND